ncbi:MAG: chromosome segregation protein SMC [Myxococcota bacterium]
MKLRRIQLVGFKSFKDKVTIELGDGMNGIVGPNGCGKSNVVDAVKWAMGDMSPKSLRGAALADVIFAGTEVCRAAGMAEVTLTFENEAADLEDEDAPAWSDSIPREYRDMAEISITRRLHKSGDSEYLINNVQCRLMDIRNLLAGTGLGKQGYSIIEQGEISFVVSAKPSERRLIIEEASGITRYKSQRDRAERKLERTEQNLQRVQDVLKEVNKQLRSLERQARRAEKHRQLSEELRSLEIASVVEQRNVLTDKAKKLRERLQDGRTTATKSRGRLEQLQEELSSAKVESFQAEKAHTELTERFYKLDTRLNLARSNKQHVSESAEDARSRFEEAQEELREQKQRREQLAEELERVQAELADLDISPEEREESIKETEREVAAIKGELRESQNERDDRRERLSRARSRREQFEQRLEWSKTQRENLEQRISEIQEQIESAGEEVEDLRRGVNRIVMDLERVEARVEQAREDESAAKSRLEDAKQQVAEARSHAEDIRSERIEVDARIQSLEEMRERGEGYEQGVQSTLDWARREGRDDVLGPVGDYLQVSEGFEAAVAAFLGDRLGDILVDNRQAALDALSFLSDTEQGRVGCLVIPAQADPTGHLDGLLDGLSLVDSLEEAPDTEVKTGDDSRAWATKSGDIQFSSGRIVGGHVGEQAETVLRQARELKALQERREDLVVREEDAAEELEVAEEDLVLAEEAFESARGEREDAKHAHRKLEQDHQAERRELERAERRLGRSKGEIEPIEESLEKLDEQQADFRDKKQAAEQAIPQLERELGDFQGQVESLETRLERRQAELTAEKVELAERRERRRSLEQNRERLERALDGAGRQIEKLRGEIEEQRARIEEFASKTESTSSELTELEQAYAEAKEKAEAARERLDAANQRVTELEVEIAEKRKDVEARQQSLQEREMALREVGIEIEHVDRNLRERFDLSLYEARQASEGVQLEESALEDKIRGLRSKLDSLGAVNPMAVEEYEEAKERKTFLEDQELDLQAAIDDLRQAIQKMDRESRRRFKETFEAVNSKFQEIFPRLFRGGSARLRLTEPDDLLNSGVDIEVSPPGKKLQNVSLLSGGEKALTAVSLIFAIFILKPSPFSVLDEVDAPLDEANVGRFAEMVKELSEMSQMIVITHNRRTMENCEMLYGVTMEDAGISKIVSLRLDDIDEKIAS